MMKNASFQANAALERKKDRREREVASAQQQVKSMTSLLATAEQNLGGDLQTTTVKAATYIKPFKRTKKKLKVATPALSDLSKAYTDHL